MLPSPVDSTISVIESLASDKYGNYIVQRAMLSFPRDLGLVMAHKVYNCLSKQANQHMPTKILQLYPEILLSSLDGAVDNVTLHEAAVSNSDF